MNSHICDKCNQAFKHAANLYRHKQHSCKLNINRTPRPDNPSPRPDITRKKQKHSDTHINIKDINEERFSIPIDVLEPITDNTTDTQQDEPTIQQQNIQPIHNQEQQ